MKITVKELKQLIREAVEQTLLKEYEKSIFKDKHGDYFIIDDEGNIEPHDGYGYEHLKPGGRAEPFDDSDYHNFGDQDKDVHGFNAWNRFGRR